MNKLIISLCGMLLFFVQGVSAQSSIAKSAFERGISAYNNKKYVEAFTNLKQAALGGVSEAYGPLIDLYADGDYDESGIGNYKEAFTWTVMAMGKYEDGGRKNQDLRVIGLMYYDPLCFLIGDYQEAIDHITKGQKLGLPQLPYLFNILAASYLKLGNIAKATEWANKAIALAAEKNDNFSHYTAKAILSKIELDKKDYNKALELSEKAASDGKVPLAAYVYGVSLIKTNNHPDIGKQWVKAAAEYDYCGISEINCFEDEIKKYWRQIMNASF